MSLTMLSSILAAALKVSPCSRRKQASASTKETYSRATLLQYAPRVYFDNSRDGAKKTVEVSEASTTDLSDGSEQVPASTDGSDAESTMIKLISASDILRGKKRSTGERTRPDSRAPMKPSREPEAAQSFKKIPPGLEFNMPTSHRLPSNALQAAPQGRCSTANTRLNSGAALFVPSFATAAPAPDVSQCNTQQVRKSIQLLKAALEELEEEHTQVEDMLPPTDPVAPSDSSSLFALQEALEKLTPQDAAIVKGLLESKEAGQNAPHMDAAMMQSMQFSPLCQGGFGDPSAMMSPGQYYGEPFPNMATGWAYPPGPMGDQVGTNYSFAHPHGNPCHSLHTNSSRQAKPLKPASIDASDSLATHLADLALLDVNRVLMVRRINHLGPDAPGMLKAYFSKFGNVDRVMISATRTAAKPGRVRPATLGFLVMDGAQAAQAALAHGAEHVLQGVTVTISTFQSHTI